MDKNMHNTHNVTKWASTTAKPQPGPAGQSKPKVPQPSQHAQTASLSKGKKK
jgi:hypothetical protein